MSVSVLGCLNIKGSKIFLMSSQSCLSRLIDYFCTIFFNKTVIQSYSSLILKTICSFDVMLDLQPRERALG